MCTPSAPQRPTFGVTITTAYRSGVGERFAPLPAGWFDLPAATVRIADLDDAHRARPGLVAASTIHVDARAVARMEFGISPEHFCALFDTGYRAAADFLDGFDWAEYRRRFRAETAALSRG